MADSCDYLGGLTFTVLPVRERESCKVALSTLIELNSPKYESLAASNNEICGTKSTLRF